MISMSHENNASRISSDFLTPRLLVLRNFLFYVIMYTIFRFFHSLPSFFSTVLSRLRCFLQSTLTFQKIFNPSGNNALKQKNVFIFISNYVWTALSRGCRMHCVVGCALGSTSGFFPGRFAFFCYSPLESYDNIFEISVYLSWYFPNRKDRRGRLFLRLPENRRSK